MICDVEKHIANRAYDFVMVNPRPNSCSLKAMRSINGLLLNYLPQVLSYPFTCAVKSCAVKIFFVCHLNEFMRNEF